MVGGVVVRGRIDAVFADPDGGWTVVDWKTGDPPRDAGTAAAVQLAAYRLAWAELSGTPVEQVRAAFHYVRQDRTVAPVDLLDAAGLHALVESIPTGGLIRSSASRATASGSCSGTQWLTPGSSTNR